MFENKVGVSIFPNLELKTKSLKRKFEKILEEDCFSAEKVSLLNEAKYENGKIYFKDKRSLIHETLHGLIENYIPGNRTLKNLISIFVEEIMKMDYNGDTENVIHDIKAHFNCSRWALCVIADLFCMVGIKGCEEYAHHKDEEYLKDNGEEEIMVEIATILLCHNDAEALKSIVEYNDFNFFAQTFPKTTENTLNILLKTFKVYDTLKAPLN